MYSSNRIRYGGMSPCSSCLFPTTVNLGLPVSSTALSTEFKKDAATHRYKDSFETKLSEKLKNRTLDKTAIALILSEKIEESSLDFNQQDEYIKYLLDSIKFVVS